MKQRLWLLLFAPLLAILAACTFNFGTATAVKDTKLDPYALGDVKVGI